MLVSQILMKWYFYQLSTVTLVQSTKEKMKEINGVVLKFGTVMEEGALNNILKVPVGGGSAGGRGGV